MGKKPKDVLEGAMMGIALGGLFVAGAIYGMKQTQPDLNTVTIHKTQDRVAVACQEGAQ